MVESARVVKRFPDRLSIFLEPRRAVAIALAEIGGADVPMYIDKYGVVFKIGNSAESAVEIEGLPILSGLTFEHPAPGMRFPSAFLPLLEDISRISVSAPELLAPLSEIRLNRKAYDDFDLVLYPIHSSIRVRLEKNLTEDTLRYVMLMLDVFESRLQKPEEIDFRAGVGSYRIKEAPSGE
jgi:cell division protein FtsQ